MLRYGEGDAESVTCRRSGVRPLRLGVVAALLGSWLLAGGEPAVRAQEVMAELAPLNHAYAVYVGSGYYLAGGRSVFVLRIAPSFRLRSEKEHSFGIRIRLNGTVGFYNFRPEDLALPEQLNTYAFVPGVEFPLELRDNWRLSPFVDIGIASDTAFDDQAYVFGTGIRSRAVFDLGQMDLVMWNDLIYASNQSVGSAQVDDYTLFRTDLELREIVRFHLELRRYDFGLLVRNERFFNSLVIFPAPQPLSIENRWEVGFTVGPTERWLFKGLVTLPRLGITYGFGDDSSSWRFLFRTRY